MLRDFKISFKVNSHVDKLFRKRKRVDQFIIMGVNVQMNDEHGTTEKGNGGCGWGSVDVVLWIGMRQNEDAIEWWAE
jgi:hypothetical protein